MIHRILVATDGSEIADRAVDRAVELAARLALPLRILCVVTDQPPGSALRDYAEAEHLGTRREPGAPVELPVAGYWSELQPGALAGAGRISGVNLALSERFVDRAVRAARDAGVGAVEGRVLAGDPADVILADAAASGSDMIVLGSHGHGAVQGSLAGSVSQKVVHHARCSVLVVH